MERGDARKKSDTGKSQGVEEEWRVGDETRSESCRVLSE